MNDEEPFIHPLFNQRGERARPVTEKGRQEAGQVVLEWLNRIEGGAFSIDETTGVSRGVIAAKVREGLKEGKIFFVVRPEEELPESIQAKSVRVKMPKIERPAPFQPEVTVITRPPEVRLVALEIRGGIGLEDLRNEQGDRELVKLYQLDQKIGDNEPRADTNGSIWLGGRRIRGRVAIKDPAYGPFPQ